MTSLGCAAIFFTVLHAGVSGTGVRDRVVARVGEQAYLGLFSGASLVAVIWLSVAYGNAPYVFLWPTSVVLKWVALPVTLIAMLLVVLGLITPNPGVVGGERALRDDPAQGILRVTRHPFLCGVAVWAAMHLAVNGDLASVILFTTLLLVSVNGIRSIDRKRRERFPEEWAAYESVTSNVPGAAIWSGRTRFVPSEIGWGRVGLTVVVYLAVLGIHPMMFGDVPWP